MNYIFVQFNCNPNFEALTDVLSAQLGKIGFESFVSIDTGLEAYISSKLFSVDKIDKLLSVFPFEANISYSYREIQDVNWNEEWEKNYFKQIVIDDKCCVHSSFHQLDKKYDYEIMIDPKMAFGTGHHQTTSLMIKEILTMNLNNKIVLDLGCGTGVLAILAKMKRASVVKAIDIDEWAYHNAIENVKLNDVDDIKVLHGDVNLLNHEKFDLILANINRNVLLNDIPKYKLHLNKGGYLLMSGFYKDDIPLIKKMCSEHNLIYKGFSEKDQWVTTTFCTELN